MPPADPPVRQPVSDADRLRACIDLCSQARERFQAIDVASWKVNFSLWGFLGAVAYFFTNPPARHVGCLSWLLLLIPVLHGAALSKLHESARGWRQWATYFRNYAKEIASIQIGSSDNPAPPEQPSESMKTSDHEWLVLEVATTLLITLAVIYLIR